MHGPRARQKEQRPQLPVVAELYELQDLAPCGSHVSSVLELAAAVTVGTHKYKLSKFL